MVKCENISKKIDLSINRAIRKYDKMKLRNKKGGLTEKAIIIIEKESNKIAKILDISPEDFGYEISDPYARYESVGQELKAIKEKSKIIAKNICSRA